MKIALTYNLKTADIEAEQEFDAPHHVKALVSALRKLGHTVWLCEVTKPVKTWLPRLLRVQPDLVFNIAEGRSGRAREAVVPTLMDAHDIPYTGSDAWTLTTTLDKHLTSEFLRQRRVTGLNVPRERLLPNDSLSQLSDAKVIIKPNYEGSSKGITEACVGSVISTRRQQRGLLKKYPDGVLVQEFIPGRDVTVAWIDGYGSLPPVVVAPRTRRASSSHNVYNYRQKGLFAEEMEHSIVVHAVAQSFATQIVAHLRVRDFARVDFRQDTRGGLWFLEVNALPSLEYDGALTCAAKAYGMTYEDMLAAIIKSATRRRT